MDKGLTFKSGKNSLEYFQSLVYKVSFIHEKENVVSQIKYFRLYICNMYAITYRIKLVRIIFYIKTNYIVY